MARVTVEDCLEHVDNRFELVLAATRRARQISHGAQPFLEWENDKPTVMALREVAAGYLPRDPSEQPEVPSPQAAEGGEEPELRGDEEGL